MVHFEGDGTPIKPSSQTIQQRIVSDALSWVGKVNYGPAKDLSESVDCSAFVNLILKRNTGKEFSWSSYDYPKFGTKVSLDPSAWEEGDIICHDSEGNGTCGHVGFFVGWRNGEPAEVSALNREKGVCLTNPVSSWFQPELLNVRRLNFGVDVNRPAPSPVPPSSTNREKTKARSKNKPQRDRKPTSRKILKDLRESMRDW